MTPNKDALAAIRAEKAFLKLSPADGERVLAALSETRSHIETVRRYDRYGDRDLRIRNRNALKVHLAPVLKILKIQKVQDDEFGDIGDVGRFDAIDWLTDCHRGNISLAIHELEAFLATAQRLLDGAIAFEPDPGRTGRGELQLRTELTRTAFYELIAVFESVSVPVRASLGPGVRLLTRLIAYAVGFAVSVNTVKALVLQRNAK